MEINLNHGDLYALMAALCWSSGVILFDISGKILDSLQINLLKNVIGFIGFVIVIVITGNIFISYSIDEYKLLIIKYCNKTTNVMKFGLINYIRLN